MRESDLFFPAVDDGINSFILPGGHNKSRFISIQNPLEMIRFDTIKKGHHYDRH
jgi:hypothetical protein